MPTPIWSNIFNPPFDINTYVTLNNINFPIILIERKTFVGNSYVPFYYAKKHGRNSGKIDVEECRGWTNKLKKYTKMQYF